MPIQTTYTQARANLASLLDEVTLNREVVIIERRGAEPVALVSADELEGLMETAYLLRSPRNAERLLRALVRAQQKEGAPQTVDALKREIGFDDGVGEA
jgi:antitoxin YefM